MAETARQVADAKGLRAGLDCSTARGRAWGALPAAFAANAAMLALYLLVTMRLEFDGDWGAKSVIAGLMLEQGRFFLQGFGYWNDLWILHGHLPLLLFIPVLGNNLLSNTLASVTCVAVLLPLVYRFLRRLEISQAAALMGTLVVACGFSEEWVSFMYGQAAYGYACLILLIGLFAAIEGLLSPVASAPRAVFLVGACVLLGCYGTRLLMTLALPAGIALVALHMTGRNAALRRIQVALAGAGLLGGLLVRAWVTRTINFHEFGSWWIAPGGSVEGGLKEAVVSLFGLLPSEPMVTGEPWGLVFPVRVLFAIALGVAFVSGCHRNALTSDRRRFLAYTAVISLALTVYLTLTIEVLAGKSRFLMPPTFLVILVATQGLDQMAASARGRRAMAVAAIPLLGLSFATYVAPLLPREDGGVPWQGRYERVRRLDRLIEALDRRGTTRAYASYMNAAALTVLSGSRIETRQVGFAAGLPEPDPLLSLATWYADAGPQPTTLLVDLADPRERDHFSLERLTTLLGPPAAVKERARFLIVHYPSNVFPMLPSWQKASMEKRLVSNVVFGPASVQTIDGVGRIEDGCLASTGEPGALVYGPYIRLPEGRYRVRLSLEVHPEGGSPGSWDISVDRPPIVYARGELPAGAGGSDIVVDQAFEIPPTQRLLPLEARVFSSGQGGMCFRRTEILRLP